ncbi:MAG: isoamylase early set domain-containing protein [Flavobacteriaceae bacterium]|nr:isoamylase early set domain-containing protein [Flavobacteriaceae bacterium]
MAISKQYLKTKPICKVTFKVDEPDAKKVSVVGDFNKWKANADVLKKLKDGTFKGTIDLEKDNSYQFRYIVDGLYKNDEQADGYVWNDFAGTDNSLLKV